MSIRTWRTAPDTVYTYEDDGELVEIPHVSYERLVEHVLHGVSLLHVTGGSLLIHVGREPTDMPGEALTTAAVARWQSGPNAKEQPEAPVELAAPAVAPAAQEPPDEPLEAADEDGLEEARAAHDDIGDGLDEASLPEEDLSEIPQSMR